MSFSHIPKALEKLDVRGRSGDWWSCICISCGKADTVGKLGFNFKTGRVSCFRGHLSWPQNTIRGYLREVLGYTDEEAQELAKCDIVVSNKKWTPRKLPFFAWERMFDDIFNHPEGLDYIVSRGFTEEDIRKYQIRFADYQPSAMPKWRQRIFHRVMVPNFEQDRCIYFVGRDVSGKQPNKYYNPVASISPKIASSTVFNLEKAAVAGDGYIELLEGVFDSMWIGDTATCMFGKKLHFAQARLMVQAGVKRVCLIPDNRGLSPRDLIRQIDELWSNEIEVTIAVLPVRIGRLELKDVNETPKEIIRERREHALPVDRVVYAHLASGRIPRWVSAQKSYCLTV